MKVAIIGGTGFVGSYLVDALLHKGHRVSLLVRPGSDHKVGAHANIVTVDGDVGSMQALESAVSGCDAVIYCIGILRENRSRGVTFEALQYQGVVDTAEAAKKAGINRFLLMSANGVDQRATPYQKTKRLAEEHVLASGLDATIFRPSVIFGDPRGRMEIATQVYQDIVKPPIPALGFHNGLSPAKGRLLMSPVHVEDVAAAFVAALEDPESAGKIYHLGGPDDVSWADLIRCVAQAADKSKWIVPFPVSAMKLIAAIFDWLPFFPVTRDQLTMLAQGNCVADGDLERLLGYRPRRFDADSLSYLVST